MLEVFRENEMLSELALSSTLTVSTLSGGSWAMPSSMIGRWSENHGAGGGTILSEVPDDHGLFGRWVL